MRARALSRNANDADESQTEMTARKPLIASCVAVATLALVACGVSDSPSSDALPPDPLGSATAALSPNTTQGDGADSPTLTPKWAKEYLATVRATDLLGLSVTNHHSSKVDAVVEVRGIGLDGRSAIRSIYTGSFAAGGTQSFSLAASDLPIRSDAVGSAAEVRTTIRGGAHDGEVISSIPLHYTRKDSQFVLTGSFPDNPARVTSPKSFDQVLQQLAPFTSMLNTPSGEVLGSDGRYADVRTLAPIGDAYHKLGQLRFLALPDAASFHSLFAPSIPKVSQGPLNVCVPWQSQFIDDGKGESVSGLGSTPASYAQAALTLANGTKVWAGTLDGSGCTSSLPLTDYTSYTLYVGTFLDTGDVQINVGTGSATTPGTPYAFGVGFSTLKVSTPVGSKPIAIHLLLQGSSEIVTNAIATMSKVLYTANGGLVEYQPVLVPSGGYQVEANARCLFDSSQSTACASGNTLYLGPNTDGTHNTQWKFVAAHEFGHLAANAAGIFFPTSYARDWSSSDPLEQGACGCGFVSDPTDRAHCLQSRQLLGDAENEAFAHYFSANVWNTLATGSQCTFVYYKNFRTDDGTINRPPFARSCSTPVKWLENHCVAAARGVEWDWLNFWRAAATDPNSTRMNDLFNILPRACGSGGCGSHAPSFADMVSAANAYYGPNDPRARTFNNLGNANGVNH